MGTDGEWWEPLDYAARQNALSTVVRGMGHRWEKERLTYTVIRMHVSRCCPWWHGGERRPACSSRRVLIDPAVDHDASDSLGKGCDIRAECVEYSAS